METLEGVVMGELLSAIRRGEKLTEAMLNRALTHTTLKTEGSREPDVPESLRKQWAKEDAENALRNDTAPKSNYIPKSLREHWQREDTEMHE